MRTLVKMLSALALIGSASALADDKPADKTPPADKVPDKAPKAPTSKADKVVPGTENVAKLTGPEITVRGAKLRTQIQTDYRHILFLKDQAKKQKDIIKVNCVNDKLVEVKAQLNIADSINDQLQIALTKEGHERDAVFIQLAGSADSVRGLREEAGVCAGEPELFKDENGGAQSYHPPFPDNPGVKDTDGWNEIEPPGYASPYE